MQACASTGWGVFPEVIWQQRPEDELGSKAHLGASPPFSLLRKAIQHFPLEALAFYWDPLEEISLTLRP